MRKYLIRAALFLCAVVTLTACQNESLTAPDVQSELSRHDAVFATATSVWSPSNPTPSSEFLGWRVARAVDQANMATYSAKGFAILGKGTAIQKDGISKAFKSCLKINAVLTTLEIPAVSAYLLAKGVNIWKNAPANLIACVVWSGISQGASGAALGQWAVVFLQYQFAAIDASSLDAKLAAFRATINASTPITIRATYSSATKTVAFFGACITTYKGTTPLPMQVRVQNGKAVTNLSVPCKSGAYQTASVSVPTSDWAAFAWLQDFKGTYVSAFAEGIK